MLKKKQGCDCNALLLNMKNRIAPKIEDKPVYCSAWVSKVNDRVMCNTIPCCGFFIDGRNIGCKYKSLKGEPLYETIGRHPLVNGKFVFDDGTIHNP